MIRHSRPRTAERDTAIAKARLRVAAVQIQPLDVVREHPWSTVLGTAAVSMAAGALLGGPPKTKVVYRRITPEGDVLPDNDHHDHKADRDKDDDDGSTHGLMALLSTGVLGQLTGVGVQLLKSYLEQKFNMPAAPGKTDGRVTR